jgi:glutathione S-transferase
VILVGQYDSFPTRRVAVALHHYGISFDRDTRSVFSDAEAIGRINPLTRIPALILDDGEVLIDSAAILDHLDEEAPADRLLVPRSGPARRKVLQATALCTGAGEKAGQIVYERHFHAARHVSSPWIDRCMAQLSHGLAEMDRRCEGPWFCGTDFSHADIAATCTVGYLRLRLPGVFAPDACPRLDALAARCEALPVFGAAPIGADERMPESGA